ncbi:hypothetical protein X975_04044, partial [Stegodyphus mimosarum]
MYSNSGKKVSMKKFKQICSVLSFDGIHECQNFCSFKTCDLYCCKNKKTNKKG